jgi:hypothetical protein
VPNYLIYTLSVDFQYSCSKMLVIFYECEAKWFCAIYMTLNGPICNRSAKPVEVKYINPVGWNGQVYYCVFKLV